MIKLKKKDIIRLVVAIVICQLAGVFGSIFTFSEIPNWYATLKKPFFSPPNWLFGPAWLTLYTLMGVSFYLVWSKGLRSKLVKSALMIFGTQLFLNALWSFLFFGLHSPFYGLVGIILLWFSIILTIFKFYKISRNAGLLLLPYLLWVTFAMSLNYFVLLLNP
jgi:tryptophan-rich sensory protein